MEALVIDQAGKLALQGAGWMVAVILGVWSFYLFMRLQERNAKYESLLERVITIAETSRAAQEKTATVLTTVGTALDTTSRAVQDLAREAEGEARETRHALANMKTGFDAIVDVIRRLRPGGP